MHERDVKINMFQWLHGDGVEFACYHHPESKLVSERERFWGVFGCEEKYNDDDDT